MEQNRNMAEPKTRLNSASVTTFLRAVADKTKRDDCLALADLMFEVTGQKGKMWGSSIVGFGQYHYVYGSGREGDWPLIGFSPRAQNISIYIMSGFRGYGDLLSRLGKHKTGKSCLYIKQLSDIDVEVLRELAVQSVNYMRDKYQCS